MVVSVGSVSAGELSANAADKPLFVGNNILEDTTVATQWRTGTATWGSGSDVTDPSYPTKYLTDRRGLPLSAPVYSAVNAFTVLCNLNPGTDGIHTVDSVLVWSHNLASLSGTITVTVQVADDNVFTTNLRTLIALTVANSRRLWSTNLGTNNRYTGVQWLRIVISTTASNFGAAPQIGEIIIGRRRQLAYPPDVPWEEQGVEIDAVDHRARSGVATRYMRQVPRRIFDPTFRSSSHDNVYGIDQPTELRSMWRECAYGTRAPIFCPNPQSLIEPAVCLVDPAIQGIPQLGPFERECRLPMFELPPYIVTEPAIPVTPPFTNGHSLSLPTTGSFPSLAKKTSPTGLTISNGLSISFWIKPTAALPTSPGQWIITMGNSSGGSIDWVVYLLKDSGGAGAPAGSNEIVFRTTGSGGSGAHINYFAQTIAINAWQHIMVTMIQNVSSACYYNGAAVSSTAFLPILPPFINNFGNDILTIGARDDGTQSITPAIIDEVAIFNATKSSSDAARYAAAPIDMSGEAGCVGFWRFENTPNDNVGTNNLTFSNGATYSSDHP